MTNFLYFSQFINETKVVLSPRLSDYTVEDLKDGKFKMSLKNDIIEFSVLPIPKNIDEFQKLFLELNTVLNKQVPLEMYKILSKIQHLSYKFGNIVSTSLSLSNIKELSLILSDEQNKEMMSSPISFLENDYENIPKAQKDSILLYLKDLCKKYAIVLECLFSYTRNYDPKNFYKSKDFDSILVEYQKVINSIKNIKFNGPYDSIMNKNKMTKGSEFAYWSFKKNDTNYMLRAIISPETLNAENAVNPDMIYDFSILNDKGNSLGKKYERFSYELLKEKIETL